MPFILALDQGTTSSRAIIFNENGRQVASAQEEFEQLFPQPGWVEHDANEIWRTQLATAQAVIENAGIDSGDFAGIGITNQRETTVVWDRSTSEPIANAIVWQDRRTASICDELKASNTEPLIREKTGLVLDAYFSATKIAWLLDHVDGARARAERDELAAGTIDSWLIWKLTGGRVHVTDASNASRTLIYNIHTGDWDDELLELFNVPRAVLPDVRDSSGVIAETDPALGLGTAPIAGIVGDQQAALAGQACLEPSLAKNTFGTGCFMLSNTGSEIRVSRSHLLTTVAWRMNGQTTYALEGSVFIGGAAVQWLRDGLGIIEHSSEIEALAASVPDSGDVVLVPAFAGLGAPHWEPNARGLVVGLTRGTTKAHIARATLDGIAFQVADLFDAMNSDAGAPISLLRVDGGAAGNDLLMQIQADLLQAPIERPKILESTALGAAFMAGLATGVWADAAQLESLREVDRHFEPSISSDEANARRSRWNDAVERSKGWAKP